MSNRQTEHKSQGNEYTKNGTIFFKLKNKNGNFKCMA